MRIPFRHPTLLALLGLLLFSAWLYWPGLHGIFILDDVPNLDGLTDVKNGHAIDFWTFVTSGLSSTLGRPLALFTFALQANDWPDNPSAFKLVNISIHLINGVLIALFFRALTRIGILGKFPYKNSLILITTAIWLLHPLQLSTVLYVVQRMTELSVLFTLVGLSLYVTGRKNEAEGRIGTAYIQMTGGVFVGVGLAILSKEIGINMCFYILVLEATLLRKVERSVYWKRWIGVFAIAPLVLLGIYLASRFQTSILASYTIRDFTPEQRVLTEFRILWSYIGTIFLPRPSQIGLFQDGYTLSTGLLSPPTTLLAIVVTGSLIIAALLMRKRAPVAAFGILWFFSGHLLESSFLPLELYFEHRNYLPMLGPIVIMSYYGIKAFHELIESAAIKKLFILLAVAWFIAITIISRNEIKLWGNPLEQSLSWLNEKPESLRAKQFAIHTYKVFGRYDKVKEILTNRIKSEPNGTGSYFYYLILGCDDARFLDYPRDKFLAAVSDGKFERTAITLLETYLSRKIEHTCPAVKTSEMLAFTQALLANKRYKRQYVNIYAAQGYLYALEEDIDKAMRAMDMSYQEEPDFDVTIQQVQWMLIDKDYKRAAEYLRKAKQTISRNPIKARPEKKQVEALGKVIQRNRH